METLVQSSLLLDEPGNLIGHIAAHSTDRGFRDRSQASEPTKALPGTRPKVEVLKSRVENGESLWHPDDAPLPRRLQSWAPVEVEV